MSEDPGYEQGYRDGSTDVWADWLIAWREEFDSEPPPLAEVAARWSAVLRWVEEQKSYYAGIPASEPYWLGWLDHLLHADLARLGDEAGT